MAGLSVRSWLVFDWKYLFWIWISIRSTVKEIMKKKQAMILDSETWNLYLLHASCPESVIITTFTITLTCMHTLSKVQESSVFQGCQKIRFKVLTWKFMRNIFSWMFSFSSGQGKLLILQQIWFYIRSVISISIPY